MSLKQFVESNYAQVCKNLNELAQDREFVEMLKAGRVERDLVKSWMQFYGLFQGFTTAKRNAIIDRYASVVFRITGEIRCPDREQLEAAYSQLYTELFNAVDRKLTSAVSKLLWCSFPNDVVIYDAFVESALIVLQGVTPHLAKFPRIGVSPAVKSEADIPTAVQFYMNYQDMVQSVRVHHQEQLDGLRNEHSEQYPYDIRIVDLLLWKLGNARSGFSLGDVACDS